MSKQNDKLFKNIEIYEKKKAKQQESKILGQKLVKRTKIKKKVHACTTHNRVKVYAVWYE